MKKNILLVIAAINVHGIRIYGYIMSNTECGKGNLEQVLEHRMSLGTINRTVSFLIKEGILIAEKKGFHSSIEGRCFTMPINRQGIKDSLKYIEL